VGRNTASTCQDQASKRTLVGQPVYGRAGVAFRFAICITQIQGRPEALPHQWQHILISLPGTDPFVLLTASDCSADVLHSSVLGHRIRFGERTQG